MKLFFNKILIFVFPLFLIVLGIDFHLRNINSLYKEKVNGLTEHTNVIEILILGNSHGFTGVDPNYFTKYAFNIANSGQSIYFDKELTLRNLEALEKLKYVFISLDYHSLYFSSQRGGRNILSYYGNGIKHSSTSYHKADISPFLFGYDPKASFSLIIIDLLAKWKFRNQSYYVDLDAKSGIDKVELTKGFIALPGTQTNDFNNTSYTNRINGFNRLINTSTEKKLVLNELDQLISTLQNNGIKPIFFSTPTFNEYNTFLDSSIINDNRVDAEILCKKYNMEFWDYAKDNDFIKDEFFNPDHLNKKGAERFSKILNSRLKLYN